MDEIVRNVRGMRDLLDKDSRTKNKIESIAKILANVYGYQEINTPIVEYSSVFNKTLGEASDIVTKEMYNFLDEKNRKLTLRPEATAGIARSIVSNGLLGSGEYRIPLKFFLIGPMFRYERPQKGRYRQFYQINFEYFSKSIPESDVELISLAYNFLKRINAPINLHINSLGDNTSRNNYKNELVSYLTKFKNDLSEESLKRLKKNPLRILDTKDNNDMKIISNAPRMNDFLSKKSLKYYLNVKELLKDLDIKFIEDNNLVRGLDYYKETVFEFKTNKLGKQQDTLLGGGRYSGLVKMFGGDDIDGAGWAAGIDRLIEITPEVKNLSPKVSIVFSEKYKKQAFSLANSIRSSEKIDNYVELIYEIKIDKQLKKANRIKSKNIIYVESKKNIKISNKKMNKNIIIPINEIEKIINTINVD